LRAVAPVSDITVETFDGPLAAECRVLDDADEALVGVAFAQQRGVNLIEHQLAGLRDSRLVCTTVFGATTSTGLHGAQARGLAVRVLNPRHGTFHPKLYLARRGSKARAAVGSANLTGALICTVESLAVLCGDIQATALRQLWDLGESWWHHRRSG
jgi:HKD family nuclease